LIEQNKTKTGEARREKEERQDRLKKQIKLLEEK